MGIAKVCVAGRVPAGYTLVPLSRAQAEGLLTIHLIGATSPEFRLLPLRSTREADVFLGCVADASQRVIDWLEVWVQNPTNTRAYCDANSMPWTNSASDAGWDQLMLQLRETLGPDFLDLSSTKEPMAPIAIHRKNFEAVSLKTSSVKSAWLLCTNEGALQRAGLPQYADTHFRYLHQTGADANSPFIPLTEDCPINDSTLRLQDVLGDLDNFQLFNPLSGRVAITRCLPCDFNQYQHVLSGLGWDGIPSGDDSLYIDETLHGLSGAGVESRSEHFLLSSPRGAAARLAESFHLKVNLMLQVLDQTHQLLSKTQLPLLNLGARSFRVGLTPVGSALPLFWTARCKLVQPGEAVGVDCPGSSARYFLPLSQSQSIYQMPLDSRFWSGSCEFALTKTPIDDRDGLIIRGTITVQDDLSVSPNDLIWLRISLGNTKTIICGHAESQKKITGGKIPFCSYPTLFARDQSAQIKGGAARFPASEFRLIPPRSSPCDLYSLGVIAVLAFLDSNRNNLRESLDWMLKLGRELTNNFEPGIALAAQVAKAFRKDARWKEALGPQHLLAPESETGNAASTIPDLLWYRLLAAISAMFPGMGPYSACTDEGAVPARALEKALEPALIEFRELNLWTRQLVINNEQMNRDILNVIKTYH